MAKQPQRMQASALGKQHPENLVHSLALFLMTFNTDYLKKKINVEQLSFHSACKEDSGKGKY